jgi:hypothetical protein
MPRPLPGHGFVVALGVIAMIVAVVEFGCGGIGAFANAFIASQGKTMPAIKEYIIYLNQNSPNWSNVAIGRSLGNLVLSFILAAVAIMIFLRARPTKIVAMIYAIPMILINIVYGFYQNFVLHPVIVEFNNTHPDFVRQNGPEDTGARIGDLISIVFHIGFAVVLVACLFLPIISAHFSPRRKRNRKDDDDDDFEDRQDD